MSHAIEDIEGIGPKYAAQLAKAGIRTTAQLLGLCCSRKGRKQVAEKTGLDDKQLLKWANMADLMRISGVGKQFAELLEAAGVDTVKELRKRRPDSLAAKMQEVNGAKKLTRRAPAQSMVERWIEQASQMEPVITH